MIMKNQSSSAVNQFLVKASPTSFSVYCIVAAFGTYFCMYAFRKPFTAGTFEETVWWGLGFKTVLVTAQVAGYTLSKFLGIKFVSEMPARHRAVAILGLIAIAELALLFFAITPAPWNFIWLFVNGLPLGMVFGFVIGFLEGRKVTEALAAGLCASFIVASGVVKSVGLSLITDWGFSEFWMPFVTGCLFVPPLLVAVWMLAQIPPPTEEDIRLRSQREPMDSSARRLFFRRHALGLIGLLVIYVLLTVCRSIRDDFAVEIWQDLGVDGRPSKFATSEFWVMVGVIIVNGLAILVKNNRLAFLTSLGLLCFGFVIVLLSIVGHSYGRLSPMAFMILLGLGMYIPYVAFHTTIFERFIAAFREIGTIGYLLYLADAVGYLGYVGVMVYQNWTKRQGLLDQSIDVVEVDFLSLMIWISLATTLIATSIAVGLFVYYRKVIPVDRGSNLTEHSDSN